ncbi:spore germination protein [Brevibacillus ginsengisoli]|uniref:spore germination protein n=1 Tax=Brevibacillus ginsengisoli TaxID=363854 RepID=UPI003CFB505D
MRTARNENPRPLPMEFYSESYLRQLFGLNDDVKVKSIRVNQHGGSTILLLYCDNLIDKKQLQEFILPRLHELIDDEAGNPVHEKVMENHPILPIRCLPNTATEEDIILQVFAGKLFAIIPHTQKILEFDIAKIPTRTPAESNFESSVRGPRDGFVESLSVNAALIRKRLRTTSLQYAKFVIGARTKTQVGLFYIEDILSKEILHEVINRLSHIEIDGIYSSTQLEQIISDRSWAFFPLLDYTSRPDYVVDCLLNGRFAILIDGNPSAIIAPTNLMQLIKSPEDVHFTFLSVTFGRLLRLIGLMLSLFLPGFWIALVSYHQDQLPFPLLATVTVNRVGLPISAPTEMLLMIILVDIFREAGVRLPTALGNTITVVGGLTIGDAAIRAGLVSPSMVVVASLTAVAGSTLVSQALVGSISVLRIIIFFLCASLGMYGVFVSFFGIVLYLSSLQSFGVPYLAPVSPINFKDVIKSIFRVPWPLMKSRPSILNPQDKSRQSGESE